MNDVHMQWNPKACAQNSHKTLAQEEYHS